MFVSFFDVLFFRVWYVRVFEVKESKCVLPCDLAIGSSIRVFTRNRVAGYETPAFYEAAVFPRLSTKDVIAVRAQTFLSLVIVTRYGQRGIFWVCSIYNG